MFFKKPNPVACAVMEPLAFGADIFGRVKCPFFVRVVTRIRYNPFRMRPVHVGPTSASVHSTRRMRVILGGIHRPCRSRAK